MIINFPYSKDLNVNKIIFWGVCILFFLYLSEAAFADPFEAVADKVTNTTKGVLKIGSVACGLAGALLIIQAVFGKLNFRWGISFVIAAILLASFDYVLDFLTSAP